MGRDSEKLKLFEKQIRQKPKSWKLRDPLKGRNMLTRDEVLQKLKKDKTFRKTMIALIDGLSIDLLTR